MGIERISLLQIGDVHLPDWASNRSSIDLKQSNFSQQIVSNLQTDSLTLILEHLRKSARLGSTDAAILMGDFTTRGDTSRLAVATQVISSLLNDTRSEAKIPIFGVPGNHDVAKADALTKGETGKFDPLVEAFKEAGWHSPPVGKHLKFSLSNNNSQSVGLYAMNSSIGSWSKALYPEGMRELIFGDQSKPISVGETGLLGSAGAVAQGLDTLEDQVYEQLDTPYFLAQDIDAIYQDIQSAGRLSVIVAHHNILPQYLPRISSFGEVLNAGYAREMFLKTNCPILYLHGHIHTDPVEIVYSLDSRSKLISISAPSLDHGYNIVHLFADEGGRFFAIKLDSIRYRNPTIAVKSKIIPVVSDAKYLLRRDVSKFWDYIQNQLPPSEREHMTWRDFEEIAKSISIKIGALEGIAVALICAGLADIDNLEVSREAWRIRLKAAA
ncbi:MAG: metallophosphoesterase family protein [Sphingomonadaceae bacterium]